MKKFMVVLMALTTFSAQAEVIRLRCKLWNMATRDYQNRIIVLDTNNQTLNGEYYEMMFSTKELIVYQYKATGGDTSATIEIDRNTGIMSTVWSDGAGDSKSSCSEIK